MPDENSGRSERRRLRYDALPREGYTGEAPAFPLPNGTSRELVVWAEVWRTPQATAWAEQPWRWRTVAVWVRWSVRMEDPEATAAVGNVVARFGDDIGMSATGLKLNGWKIADPAAETAPAAVTDIRDRLPRGARD